MSAPLDARETAGLHGLFWLVVANGVGLLLGLLLLAPELNDLMAPLTFGRWLPLHLDLHLYGWLSLPLMALLFQAFGGGTSRLDRAVVWAWSTALVVGAMSWLLGASSGKLFLEWSGFAKLPILGAMVLFWLALARGYGRSRGAWSTRQARLRLVALIMLSAIPLVFFQALKVEVYPPINPNSGGATGTSLLGSTLGMVALFLVTPYLVAKPIANGRQGLNLAALLAMHLVGFALAGHGDRANDSWGQILALGSLLIWVPLLWQHYRRFSWPEGAKVWLAGFALWGALLTASGWVAFLPGVLERWKFGHGLVAHAHLAMAGMLTSFVVLVLLAMVPRLSILGARRLAWFWQMGLALQLVALMALSELEVRHPVALFDHDETAMLLLGLRLGAGCAMFSVSLIWLWRGLCPFAAVQVPAVKRAEVSYGLA